MAPATSTPVGPPPTITRLGAGIEQAGPGLGRFEEAEQVVAHPYGVFEAVERKPVLSGTGNTEVVRDRASGDDEVVKGNRWLVAELHPPGVPVDAHHLSLAEQHLPLAANIPRTT
jgi:hypothetical protein